MDYFIIAYDSLSLLFVQELAVGNIVRRVLRIIREEYRSIPEEGNSATFEDTFEGDEEDTSNYSPLATMKYVLMFF